MYNVLNRIYKMKNVAQIFFLNLENISIILFIVVL